MGLSLAIRETCVKSTGEALKLFVVHRQHRGLKTKTCTLVAPLWSTISHIIASTHAHETHVEVHFAH